MSTDETPTSVTPPSPAPFDVCGPLPTGTCVIEASAGTGKTWTITALAVRFVAEGRVRLDEVMLVTFSRAATGELRHRVYTRLRETLAALDAHLAEPGNPADPVVRLLVDAPTDEVERRRDRVRDALADIDAATIATTHEFCQRMLGGLGLLVDHDRTTRFAENVDDLVGQVVDDVYLAHEVAQGSPQPPSKNASFARFAEVGRAALAEPDAPLVPVEPQGLSRERVDFAVAVRSQFEARKRRAGVYTFDDMVRRLRDALFDPVTGEEAVEALSSRYPLVLIDEFQDTDPTQWQIVRRAFVGHSTVVLIGDPKQAIYAFRGADVNAYLEAVAEAEQVWTLPVNHRSDPGVVQGVLEVFGGAAMGSPRIVARPVQAARSTARLRPAPDAPGSTQAEQVAVQVRVLQRPGGKAWGSRAGARAVDADLVGQVVGLLEDGWQVWDEADQAWRAVEPRDIAVLVRANRRGEQVRQALSDAGVSAVFGGARTVMASEAAQAWLSLLRALTDASTSTMKRAALGCLIGWDEQQLASAVAADDLGPGQQGGRTMPELAVQVKTLARVLAEQGVSAVFEALCDQTALYRRLLGRPDGERVMTDVRHVAQLLNEAAVRQQLSPGALTAWLADRVEEARRSSDDDRTRRLETDASCVQVMTIHGAKGLEFPIVLLPEAANEWVPEPRPGRPYVVHLDGERVLDVGVDAQWQLRHQAHLVQERAENLRTLYVAMTRAQSRLVMWWAPTKQNTEASALHRLLNGPRTPGEAPEAAYPIDPDPTATAHLDPALVNLQAVTQTPARTMVPPAGRHAGMDARRLGRGIDHTWRRTSYSGLTQDVHGQRATPVEQAEVDEVELDQHTAVRLSRDEFEEAGSGTSAPLAASPGAPIAPLVSSLGPLPGGTQFGSLVHSVLEVVDATSETLEADLAEQVARFGARLPVDGLDTAALARGLLEVLRTPLGGLTDGLPLAAWSPRDRLAELDFELPLGNRARTAATLDDVAAALQDVELTGNDGFARRYGAHLAASGIATKTLRGFLTGSIDVVLRTPPDKGVLRTPPDQGAQSEQRFVVLDYKTNRIPVGEGEELTVRHYTPEAMELAMVEAHYPLQALLYSVALHRFLTWRLPGYRSEAHLGGVGYLFVRGMAGPATPVVGGMPCGVFTWHPTPALVERVSDLLSGTTVGGRR